MTLKRYVHKVKEDAGTTPGYRRHGQIFSRDQEQCSVNTFKKMYREILEYHMWKSESQLTSVQSRTL